MQELIPEFEPVKAQGFELDFRYPTAAERDRLKIVRRDMSDEQRKRLDSHERSLSDLLEAVASRTFHPEDLDSSLREKLEILLREPRDDA